jgi:DNA-binding HxlR family transcriptional regulator
LIKSICAASRSQAHSRSNRYGTLKRAVRGVSDKMLIQQLRELEADGIVTRKDYHEVRRG